MRSEKPNILLITTDQQHYSTLGKFNSAIKTPHLDALADEGIIFTNAYCCDQTCTPSRASILTGKYPSEHGAWSLGTRLNTEDNILLTDCLKQAGYRTVLIGKSHFEPLRKTDKYPSIETTQNLSNLDFWRDFHGPYYGFEYVEMTRGHGNTSEVGEHYAVWLEERLSHWRDYFLRPTGNLPHPPLFVGEILPQKWNLPEKYHHSRWIEERSIAMLNQFKENDENNPFFMWISFADPHYPHVCPEPWSNLHDPNTISVPKKKLGEHRNSNPILKVTQKSFAKFILKITTRLQSFIWKIKLKINKKTSKKGEAVDFSNFEGIFRKLKGFRKISSFIDYYSDFVDNEQKPFFIHGLHPHVQFRNQKAKSLAMMYGKISLIDNCIGNIMATLVENEQSNDTIIIFTTDHGDQIGEHGLYYKGPFPYQAGMKVPFIVRIPGTRKPSEHSHAYISLADIAPSILKLVGLEIPEQMTGIDQSEVFTGNQKSVRDHIICEFRETPIKIFMATFIMDHFKIVFYYKRNFGELFDLKKDPEEYHNLWDDHRYKKLKKRLMLDYVYKRVKSEQLEDYKKIWKDFTIDQLYPVVWEYMLGKPDIMPRIADA
ncbi:MAG: sulfatase-like hydrolase/transferase [Candidatus Lokiarchaeota archaeon]|nr:sulfatase-like hydrolase/transferase [Candidatus Lokiarchaeota archaeon]